jgi:hypothetical protein
MKRRKLTISVYDGARIILATSDPHVVEATMNALETRLGVPPGTALKALDDSSEPAPACRSRRRGLQ